MKILKYTTLVPISIDLLKMIGSFISEYHSILSELFTVVEFIFIIYSFVIFNSLQYKFKENFNENLVGLSMLTTETETLDNENAWKTKFKWNLNKIKYSKKYFRFHYILQYNYNVWEDVD